VSRIDSSADRGVDPSVRLAFLTGGSGRQDSEAVLNRDLGERECTEPTSGGRGPLPSMIRSVLTALAVGEDVPPQLISDAFTDSVDLLPPIRDVVLGSLMTAVMARGPVADDVVALLRGALAVDERPPAQAISGRGRPVVVMAGSGKKGLRTLNVSTPAALVAAAAGAKIIKVGSAATSSALGSRDLVHALGLREHCTATDVQADLADCGFAFVAVEPEIPVLDRLYGGRFHAPNPFSFGLAVLASPVRGDITVFGLSHPHVDVAAEVLRRFGIAHADIVSTRLSGGHYLDEIGPEGEVRWCQVRAGKPGPLVTQTARELIGPRLSIELPVPHSSEEAIERTADLLAGHGLDSHRSMVCLNAGHLLLVSGIAGTLRSGMTLAEDVLRSGSVLASVPRPDLPAGVRDR